MNTFMTKRSAMLSAKTNEWSTPHALFHGLDQEFHFTLDVAASVDNTKCKKYFTKETDGLRRSWGGQIVWCNPPYSELQAWIQKAHLERRKGTTTVMLIPSRTDTAAFHQYIYKKRGVQIRFLRGRIFFEGARWNAPFPSMVVIFRPL